MIDPSGIKLGDIETPQKRMAPEEALVELERRRTNSTARYHKLVAERSPEDAALVRKKAREAQRRMRAVYHWARNQPHIVAEYEEYMKCKTQVT